jgi:hypothetical protein
MRGPGLADGCGVAAGGIGEVDDVSVLLLAEALTPDAARLARPTASRSLIWSARRHAAGRRQRIARWAGPLGPGPPNARAPGISGLSLRGVVCEFGTSSSTGAVQGEPRRAGNHADRRRSRRAGHRRRGREGGRGRRSATPCRDGRRPGLRHVRAWPVTAPAMIGPGARVSFPAVAARRRGADHGERGGSGPPDVPLGGPVAPGWLGRVARA